MTEVSDWYKTDGSKRGLNVFILVAFAGLFLFVLPPFAGAQAGNSDQQDAPSKERVQSAIEGGLKWLAEKQVSNGSSGHWQAPKYPTAATSFAGLAFLANGHLPGDEKYGETVRRAMRYVKDSMKENGYLGARGDSMYAHAISTIFGLSYMGMAEKEELEPELADWGRRSINLILKAQKVRKTGKEKGGWRYTPYTSSSDLSVTSWQLLSLHAARQSGYRIPNGAFRRALAFVNGAFRVEKKGNRKKAGFVYRPGVSKTPEIGVTGAAVFIKRILEDELDSKAKRGVKLLREHTPSWGGKQYKGYFYLGTFYIEQGLFQVGGEAWKSFKPAIQKVLLEHQKGDGHWGFPPDNKKESRLAGEAYSTAMAILILSLDKQYLPMYQRQKRLY